MPDPDWWHALWPRPGEVLERLGIEPEAEVVDLCCGDGLFTIPLARMIRHVAAIDLDLAMLALARNRAFAEGLTNCTFTGGDLYDLAKLVAGHVDWVLIANTFHGVDAVPRLPVECRLIAAAINLIVIDNLRTTYRLHQPLDRGPVLPVRLQPGPGATRLIVGQPPGRTSP